MIPVFEDESNENQTFKRNRIRKEILPILKQETAQNLSAGFSIRPNRTFTLTADGYWVTIQNRIVLTGPFSDQDDIIGATLRTLRVGYAQFFTNALSTKTLGADVILTNTRQIGPGVLTTSLAANFNQMTLGGINTTDKLKDKKDVYFDEREKAFLLASAPKSKVNLTFDYLLNDFRINLRFVRFAAVDLVNFHLYDNAPKNYVDHYAPRLTTDLSMSYNILRQVSLTIGGSNLFDSYPTRHDPNYTETGGMYDAVQMGFGGRYLFAKLQARF